MFSRPCSKTRMPSQFTCTLPDEAATQSLGRCLARCQSSWQGCVMLLDGELGAGKTTLVRALVRELPGGTSAEVSSPSFNICNIYPTRPQVVHFDLYRLEETGPDESLFEWLEQPDTALIIEWARFMHYGDLPHDLITLHIEQTPAGRVVHIGLQGRAEHHQETICAALAHCRPTPC
ncbi:MAG: tRNA (adenosine(37)-N6)-threonylcarbamoyltransferase complex ATPase subunit type 1 TsaE [Desulfohalobium sp.]